jgi:hypothetical protein
MVFRRWCRVLEVDPARAAAVLPRADGADDHLAQRPQAARIQVSQPVADRAPVPDRLDKADGTHRGEVGAVLGQSQLVSS